ncbi:hypothetical protein HPB52_005007 [Rhipicephalus sanguineus]|uniref:Presenilin n=1 Tax=Rhipicephalus sanguineus TaxID=34632 RepID=A0A9D4QDD9_RHISA|nr:hypothetical protein HPB52_005007 [Rhipicephalus sanguineus]
MAQERQRIPANVLWEVLDDALTHVVRILTAVSCCMLLVIVTIKLSPHFLDNGGDTLPYTPLPDTDEQLSLTRATNAAANALLLLGVVIVMTVLMATLYYYRFYSVIGAWITLACATILFMSPVTYMDIVFHKYNVPADLFSVGFFVYNFMALGLVVILSKGPLLVQQFYLVVESSFMAIMLLKFLPAWTLWVVLCLIPLWDLVAVLSVVGPLRILVETAQERKEGLQPGLVFSTMVVGTFPGMAKRRSERGPSKQRRSHGRRTSERRQSDVPGPSSEGPLDVGSPGVPLDDRRMSYRRPSDTGSIAPEPYDLAEDRAEQAMSPVPVAGVSPSQGRPDQVRKPLVDLERKPSVDLDMDSSFESSLDDQETQGIKMGLGDFVFYSVLVGKVATFGDWTIVCACFVGILVGICVTLFVLAIMQMALPALPVSLAFGLTFVGFHQLIQSFMNELFTMQALHSGERVGPARANYRSLVVKLADNWNALAQQRPQRCLHSIVFWRGLW